MSITIFFFFFDYGIHGLCKEFGITKEKNYPYSFHPPVNTIDTVLLFFQDYIFLLIVFLPNFDISNIVLYRNFLTLCEHFFVCHRV